MRPALWINDNGGQAIIVIAACMAVLIGALAFAVDWGYALAQRRVMQNISDAAVLGAGKYLATGVIMVNSQPAFAVTQQETWCAAKAYDLPNRSFAAPNAPTQLDIFYGDSASPTNWTTGAKPAGETCPATGGTLVPASTIYVRVVAATTFRSLAGSVVGHSSSTAAASARVRLSGTGVPVSGLTWAMVRHFDPTDYNISCPPATCDPATVDPVTFWSPNADDVVYGSFKGLVNLSRYSPRLGAASVPQLITEWDQSSHAPNPLQLDQSTPPSCTAWGQDIDGNWLWDSEGEASESQDNQCSIPNWFYYSFRGRLSLDSSWSGAALPAGQEAPTALSTRAICSAPPDPAPSCVDSTLGDWVETSGANLGNNVSDPLIRAIQDRGRVMPFSDRPVPGGGPGQTFGKGLTVLVFLWDCGEEFSPSGAPGNQWDLVVPTSGPGSGDCSQLRSNTGTPDRVHLFTAAPFTFYEGLVDASKIRGYWGGAFGDPDGCENCALNALANTAVLIPDD